MCAPVCVRSPSPLGVQRPPVAADAAGDDAAAAPLQPLGRQRLAPRAAQADGPVGRVGLGRGRQRLLGAAGGPLPLVVVAAEGELVLEGAAAAAVAAALVVHRGHAEHLRAAPGEARRDGCVSRAPGVRCGCVTITIGIGCGCVSITAGIGCGCVTITVGIGCGCVSITVDIGCGCVSITADIGCGCVSITVGIGCGCVSMSAV